MSGLIDSRFKDFWRSKNEDGEEVRFRVLQGGRCSGKSHMFATMAIILACRSKRKFLCLRMQQNRIADSVYTLLIEKIEALGKLGEFHITADSIQNKATGSVFKFYGYQRNAQEIKSFEGGKGCICWFEEAHSITPEVFNLVRPTILRNDASELWFSFNPDLEADFSYQRLVVDPPDGTITKQLNYYDNKYLSKLAIADIEAQREEDPELFKNIYLGIPKTDDELALIKRSWVEASIDAHEKLNLNLSGARIVGYDVADSGGDRNVCAIFNGYICEDIDVWKAKDNELVESALRAYAHCEEVDNASLIYDSCGLGAHVGSTIQNLKRGESFEFVSSGAVKHPESKYLNIRKNEDHFENLKAQAWVYVADRFRNTFNAINSGKQYKPEELISISSKAPHLDTLIRELSMPQMSKSGRGLLKVESKQDIKKRLKINKSPDIADAFVMGCSLELTSAGDFDFTKFDYSALLGDSNGQSMDFWS